MEVPERGVELLLSGVIGLVVWIFRSVTQRHEKEFEEYKKAQEERWRTTNADNARREEIEGNRRKDLEDEFVKMVSKQSEQTEKILNELWAELKDFRMDRRRYDEETWKQINNLKDRQAAFELQQAKSYHTKAEFDALLIERLDPIKRALTQLQGQVGNRRQSN